MIKEVYVSFEVAKLLKEKGFNTHCDTGWCEELFNVEYPRNFSYGIDKKETWISRPTHQLAMAWLREEHNIHISVTIGCDVDNSNYIFYWAGIAKFTESSMDYIDPFGDAEFKTYEEAVEVALKYTLENLI